METNKHTGNEGIESKARGLWDYFQTLSRQLEAHINTINQSGLKRNCGEVHKLIEQLKRTFDTIQTLKYECNILFPECKVNQDISPITH